MKAILKFNLDEEAYEFKSATQAIEMKIGIDDFYNVLRDIDKYDSPHFEDKDVMFDYIRAEFFDSLGEFLHD